MFYYAFIDENNICTGVYAMPSEIPVATYIPITEEQYTSQSVVGKYYNEETNTWEDPIIFSCSTNDVEYKDTGSPLSTKLDNMDTAIEDATEAAETAADAAATAAEAAHTHSNKTVLDGITAEKISAWDAAGSGSGAPGADGADGEDGEDGATFTPSVSDDGVLSWTNDKGLANPTAVNIRGPQGATGPQGPAGPAGADGADGQDGTNGVSPTVSITKNGTVTTIVITDANGTHTATINDGADGEDGAPGTEISAAQILSKLIGIDGSGSGLDADKLDGYDSSAFATAGHSHSEYAPSTHSHSGYAASNHSHTGYASSNHSHDDYFEKSGGTISGETNFSGGLVRLKGVQTLFHSGNQLVFGSNNLPSRIAGSSISATQTIQVDSDARLKENIKDVDADKMAEFIKNIDVKTFNYIGNDAECIGAIAQQVQAADPEVAKYLVSEAEDGFLSVKVADLVFPLIAAVQKLAAEVEALKNR